MEMGRSLLGLQIVELTVGSPLSGSGSNANRKSPVAEN